MNYKKGDIICTSANKTGIVLRVDNDDFERLFLVYWASGYEQWYSNSRLSWLIRGRRGAPSFRSKVSET